MLDRPLVADFLVHRVRCIPGHTPPRQLAFGIRLPRISPVIIPEHRPDRLLKHMFRSGGAETLVFAQPAPGFEAGQHVECLDEVGIAGNLFRKQASARIARARPSGTASDDGGPARQAGTAQFLQSRWRVYRPVRKGRLAAATRSDDRDRLLDTAECCFNSVENLASPQRITSPV